MKLLSPKTDISRPIIDRVKESLFSVLYKYGLPKDKTVADLFCGVGSLGIEALSRNAKFVTFVENDVGIIKTLEKNIEKSGFIKASKVVKANVFIFSPRFYLPVEHYDLVFIDPPYFESKHTSYDSKLGKLLLSLGDVLVDDGIAVIRTEKEVHLLEKYGDLSIIERREWGGMAVTLLQRVI